MAQQAAGARADGTDVGAEIGTQDGAVAGSGASADAPEAGPLAQWLVRHAGWLLAGLGVVLLILGWYGISGQAAVAEQLPYLASASLPGAALLVGGLVVAVGRSAGRQTLHAARQAEETAHRIAVLYTLLVEAADAGAGPATAPDRPDPAAGEKTEAASAEPER